MARIGIVSGLLLCVVTAFALFGSVTKAPLLFVPMMLGIPTLFFGVVALNPHRRRNALATSSAVVVLGLLIGFGQLFHLFSIWRNDHTLNPHYARVVTVMVTICLIYLVAYGWNWTDLVRSGMTSGRRQSG